MTSPALYSVLGKDGLEFDAHFAVEVFDGQTTLVFESRGGSRGADNERNSDYAPGLTTLLSRLGSIRLTITDAVVDSHTTQRMGLSHQERRLVDSELNYPIDPATFDDVDELRKRLCSSQRPIGRQPDAQGPGNNTKRIRMFLQHTDLEPRDLAKYLAGWTMPPANSEQAINASQVATVSSGEFDPTSIMDARKRTVCAIVLRQGQPAFRSALLTAYDSRCAVTGCDVVSVLEAAHIVPYRGSETNDVRNGLLLRSDIHTLFDYGLIAFDTATEPWTIVLSFSLAGTEYAGLAGKAMRLPDCDENRPSKTAIDMHRRGAGI